MFLINSHSNKCLTSKSFMNSLWFRCAVMMALAPLIALGSFADLAAAKGGKESKAVREKIISREGRSSGKANSKTKIDFDDAEIGGARKNPMASMLTNGKAKKDYDLVPIRTDWKPEMIQSASSLDAGRMK